MQTIFSLFFFGVLSFSLLGQESKNFITSLDGRWTVLDVVLVEEVPFLNLRASEPSPMNRVNEDSPWDSYVKNDLVFEKDSMYSVRYPIEIRSAERFWLDSGYVHVQAKDRVLTYPAELVNDTLLFYTQLRSEARFFKETYVRANLNDSVFNVMKKSGVNYPELAGTWYLVREEDYDYGTYYELKFPYSLPDSIVLTRKQMIAALDNEKTFWMLTGGVKRDYSFYYDNQNMFFVPGKWYKGEDPWIHFYLRNND